MESKLFVGNLAYSTTEDELRDLFAKAGAVTSVAVIKDRDTGRSKGFAFVEMASPAEAEKAISMFNGTMVGGRTIAVNIARPKEDRPRGGGFGGDRGGFRGGDRGGDRGGFRGGRDNNRNSGGGQRRY